MDAFNLDVDAATHLSSFIFTKSRVCFPFIKTTNRDLKTWQKKGDHNDLIFPATKINDCRPVIELAA